MSAGQQISRATNDQGMEYEEWGEPAAPIVLDMQAAGDLPGSLQQLLQSQLARVAQMTSGGEDGGDAAAADQIAAHLATVQQNFERYSQLPAEAEPEYDSEEDAELAEMEQELRAMNLLGPSRGGDKDELFAMTSLLNQALDQAEKEAAAAEEDDEGDLSEPEAEEQP